jgi:putative peptide zinc metalloprotease protein
MENALLQYNYELTMSSKGVYVLSYKQYYYQIGEDMYRILSFGKEAKDLPELYKSLNTSVFTLDELALFLNKSVLPLFNKTEKETALHIPSGFWFKKDILSIKQLNVLAKPIQPLFGKLFFPILFMLIAFNILFYQHNTLLYSSAVSGQQETFTWVASYILLFLLMFLHELGHVAAAIRSGVQPKSLGVSFYTVLPVMYTDLTSCWKLNKKDRLKVNLAGIFMQLILGVIIFISAYFISEPFFKNILCKLLFVNYTIIFINLVPFMKFDGYWVLSDLFGVPDMIKASNNTLLNLVTKKGPFDDQCKKDPLILRTFLYIYSALRLIFVLLCIIGVFVFIYFSFIKTLTLILNVRYLDWNIYTVLEVLKRIAFIIVIYLFTRKYTKLLPQLIPKRNVNRAH